MPDVLTEAELHDPIAKHLRTQFISLPSDITVAAAIESLRAQSLAGNIVYLYVVTTYGMLCGVCPVRKLLWADPQSILSSVMVSPVLSLPHTADVLEACDFLTQHRLLAAPVVDDDGRLIGVIDVEHFTPELTELDRRRDDLFQLIGVRTVQARHASLFGQFQTRFPWLLCNLAGGLMAAGLASAYDQELSWNHAALALFIPVMLALSESVSIQSVSLALQMLHREPVTWRGMASRLGREAGVGLMLGCTCAAVVALTAGIWLRDPVLVYSLLAGIGGGVLCAAMIGVAIPFGLRFWKSDPRVAGGPVALAATDLVALLIYFNVARWLLAAD